MSTRLAEINCDNCNASIELQLEQRRDDSTKKHYIASYNPSRCPKCMKNIVVEFECFCTEKVTQFEHSMVSSTIDIPFNPSSAVN